MNRSKEVFPRADKIFELKLSEELRSKLLSWADRFDSFLWLDSNRDQEQVKDPYGRYSGVLAADVLDELKIRTTDKAKSEKEDLDTTSFQALRDFRRETADHCFGFLSYDLKNELEDLRSDNPKAIDFPDLYFFRARKLIFVFEDSLRFSYPLKDAMHIDKDLAAILEEKPKEKVSKKVEVQANIEKSSYLEHVKKIKAHIARGDIYEVNFCQEYRAERAHIEPISSFLALNRISKAPFAALMKCEEKYLLCSSPERFIWRGGNRVISQPIKGTAKRSTDLQEDQQIAAALRKDPKERSENVMIVDLVRNDLSKLADKGSVKVQALCEVQSFKQVHQLVSTVEAQVEASNDAVALVKALFPMGSMTGAPKVSAMKIIEAEESFQRGLFSGAVGYFSPDEDMDFNVVIRSILYDALQKKLSFSVGGAITALSDPEKEFEECALKAKAMIQIL